MTTEVEHLRAEVKRLSALTDLLIEMMRSSANAITKLEGDVDSLVELHRRYGGSYNFHANGLNPPRT